MDVNIVGDGVFGTFLKDELSSRVNMTPLADVVILAVPASAYEEVARSHSGKHLVNVCSIQDQTTNMCLRFSDRVTSIHPMFGPRSPREGRTCILTHCTADSVNVIRLFNTISDTIVTEANGSRITPELHDVMMSKTHLQVIRISDEILRIAREAQDIPDDCLPTSFKRLRSMAEQMLDMPAGTRESILSNKHVK